MPRPRAAVYRAVSLDELQAWIWAIVDSHKFEDWKQQILTTQYQAVVKTNDGVSLVAKRDVDSQTALHYKLAIYRGEFVSLIQASCRLWGRRPDSSPDAPIKPLEKDATAEIAYMGVIWRLTQDF
ncbi:hypothetical protein O1611_g387 [Lasiodiplodia mahajangana]|uniref:Uncharacterized protein n=1 Tax=Lasiodiplodia mahajangana TaxID=1108764 RepID=A0ACC2K0C4_9PEZI|nr:hypothetical protein O1611_g387 [Lasiodiplodia mahajangana]